MKTVLLAAALFASVASASPEPVLVQRIESRLRTPDISLPSGTLIDGMRRRIITTTGDHLSISYFMTGSTTTTSGGCNEGLVVVVDGDSPEYSLYHQTVNFDDSGYNWSLAGETTVTVGPGTHIIELRSSIFTGTCAITNGNDFAFEVGPIDNQQENAMHMVIDELHMGEWSPTQIPAVSGTDSILVAWYRADMGLAVDGDGRVISWEDQSGNGNTLTQLTLAKRPLKVENALNGKPVVRFTRTRQDFLNFPPLQERTTTAIMLVGTHPSQSGRAIVMTCSGTNCFFPEMAGTTNLPRLVGAGTASPWSTTVTGSHLYIWECRGSPGSSSYRLRVDDAVPLTGGNNSCDYPGQLVTLGVDSADAGDMDVAEIMIWADTSNGAIALNPTDEHYVRDMLNHRWLVYTEPSGL